MARKEDMLPPGWDDLDRYDDRWNLVLVTFHFGKSALTRPCRQMGQLFMMGFDGTEVNPQIRSLIENYHLGAVLLSAKNLKCIGFGSRAFDPMDCY